MNQPGQWPPPPPPSPAPPEEPSAWAPPSNPQYPGAADIRADDPVHYGAPTVRPSRGLVGWLTGIGLAIVGGAKWLLLLVKAVPALGTLTTALISFAAYALVFGPWFGAGLVLMILVHEMGHVLEIRRQGMKATAPLFIPFMGAAIFQRSMPQDALKQAQVAIAGPLLGTVGATTAFVLYAATGWPQWLLFAYLGFWLNLFNMLPVGFLDGGWIMGAVSKWFQVVGVALLAAAVYFFHLYLSPVLIILALLMIPTIIARFRNDKLPYYQSVTPAAKLSVGVSWLTLVLYLGIAMVQTQGLLEGLRLLR
jgi:Zn-dependent protease